MQEQIQEIPKMALSRHAGLHLTQNASFSILVNSFSVLPKSTSARKTTTLAHLNFVTNCKVGLLGPKYKRNEAPICEMVWTWVVDLKGLSSPH